MVTLSKFDDKKIDGRLAQTLLSRSDACIKLIDPDGHLRDLSPNGQDVMAIDDLEGVKGREWWSIWPRDAEETLRSVVSAAGRGVSVTFNAECPTAAGTPKHWEVRVSQVQGGALHGMILAASRDISDRVALERKRDRISAENKALREFARFAAHDLRGPVRHQRLLAEMICDAGGAAASSDEVASCAAQIKKSADDLLTLMAGLEQLNDLDASLARAAVVQPLSKIIHAAARDADLTRFTLDLRADAPDVDVAAHGGGLTTALTHLFRNAIQYSDAPHTCTVRVDVSRPEAGKIQITVSDNGPGFSTERLSEIFLPMVRQSRGAGSSGAGLGLAIVQKIVTAHDGSVSLMSPTADTLGGAVLRLVLPQARRGDT